MAKAAPGPEHTAKHELTEWLEAHGARVWWEEANAWDHRQFTIKRAADAGGIPDLVVQINGYTLVVEFKSGDSVGNVYDAMPQLHGYWAEHLSTNQRYLLGGRVVEPDAFLTASKNSKYGRVFPTDVDEEPDTVEEFDQSRVSCVRRGELPPAEFRMTEQHVRTLWRLGKRTRENSTFDVDNPPALGVLLSDHLEQNQLDPTPAVLWNRGRSNQDWVVFD